MSMFVSKKMTACNGKDMKEIVGNFVKEQPTYSYNKDFEVVKENCLAINLSELVPADCEQKTKVAKEKGLEIKNYNVESLKNYEKKGFHVVEKTDDSIIVSRPHDDKVLNNLHTFPVSYKGNALCWGGNYRCNSFIETAISKHFPEITFEVVKVMETEVVDRYFIRNGEIVEK